MQGKFHLGGRFKSPSPGASSKHDPKSRKTDLSYLATDDTESCLLCRFKYAISELEPGVEKDVWLEVEGSDHKKHIRNHSECHEYLDEKKGGPRQVTDPAALILSLSSPSAVVTDAVWAFLSRVIIGARRCRGGAMITISS